MGVDFAKGSTGARSRLEICDALHREERLGARLVVQCVFSFEGRGKRCV